MMNEEEILNDGDEILELEDENGQPIKVKIYQSFHSDKFNKDIVFIEYVDDNPDGEIEAFYYDEETNALCALSDEEYIEAEKFFEENKNEPEA